MMIKLINYKLIKNTLDIIKFKKIDKNNLIIFNYHHTLFHQIQLNFLFLQVY